MISNHVVALVIAAGYSCRFGELPVACAICSGSIPYSWYGCRASPRIASDRTGRLAIDIARAALCGAAAELGRPRRKQTLRPDVVARTSMTATVMKRVALNSAAGHRLVLFPPPIPLPEIVFDLIWHRRSDSHPAQEWLRGFIAEHAASL